MNRITFKKIFNLKKVVNKDGEAPIYISNSRFGLFELNLIHIGNMEPGLMHRKTRQEFEDGPK